MKFQYTDAAKAELHTFQKRQVELLEEALKQKKYVFGDEVVEITASDIRDAASSIRLIRKSESRWLDHSYVLAMLYTLGGALMLASGFLLPDLERLMTSAKKEQIFLILGGGTMIALGLVMRALLIRREEKEKVLRRRYETVEGDVVSYRVYGTGPVEVRTKQGMISQKKPGQREPSGD